jgi:hypothetical protein
MIELIVGSKCRRTTCSLLLSRVEYNGTIVSVVISQLHKLNKANNFNREGFQIWIFEGEDKLQLQRCRQLLQVDGGVTVCTINVSCELPLPIAPVPCTVLQNTVHVPLVVQFCSENICNTESMYSTVPGTRGTTVHGLELEDIVL